MCPVDDSVYLDPERDPRVYFLNLHYLFLK
jgi:hypothetical protein